MKGKIILEGRYRIIQRLSQRPRLNLYLGRRLLLSSSEVMEQEVAPYEPLVAIRELLLTDLSPHIRAQIEQAAFEEFVSPTVSGTPRLPRAGDRVWIEGERHYLIMQLNDVKTLMYERATTLDALLLDSPVWPSWLHIETVLNWGIQLCRMVARLHHQGVIVGNLTPTTILVDSEGRAAWSPLLLPSWPPAPHYWKVTEKAISAAHHLHSQVFPIAKNYIENTFAAPETLNGMYDERSDVYSLGSILYLLLTQYAPAAAMRRLYVVQENVVLAGSGAHASSPFYRHQKHAPTVKEVESIEGLELIAPRALNKQIPPELERIVVRALELEPARRYSSVFAMVEALEEVV